MTISDYNIVTTMLTANIAHLKARLSYYLSQVRRGQEILVMDRRTPVARVVASGQKPALPIEEPRRPARDLKAIRYPRIKSKADAVRALREDRDRR